MSSHEKFTSPTAPTTLREEIKKIRPEDFESFEGLLKRLSNLSREDLINEFQKIVETKESFDTALQILYFFDRFPGNHSSDKIWKKTAETLKERFCQEANDNIERTEESDELYDTYNPEGRISVGGVIGEPYDFMRYAMDFVCQHINGPELDFHELKFPDLTLPHTPDTSESIDSPGAEEAKPTPPLPSVILPFFDTSSRVETSGTAQEKVANGGAGAAAGAAEGNSAEAEPPLPPSEPPRDHRLFRNPLDIQRPHKDWVIESAAQILQKDPPTGDHPEVW
jgi:hypothetical protein